jgi:hypothetical protein
MATADVSAFRPKNVIDADDVESERMATRRKVPGFVFSAGRCMAVFDRPT